MGAVPTYVYAVFGIVFISMSWWIVNRARQNRESMMEENKPAIAGSDVVQGSANDSGQFDEPDDEALSEMADLLEEAAESQGLAYKE